MAEAHLIATHIDRPPAEVDRFLANHRNYARWAAVTSATFRQIGPLEWAADTDFGPRIVRFSPPNDEGIHDHAVYAEGEEPVMMPLRIAPDRGGTLVTFVFYRRPNMSLEQLTSALEWIRMDFAVLKSLVEA
jgi:hypothetical protein